MSSDALPPTGAQHPVPPGSGSAAPLGSGPTPPQFAPQFIPPAPPPIPAHFRATHSVPPAPTAAPARGAKQRALPVAEAIVDDAGAPESRAKEPSLITVHLDPEQIAERAAEPTSDAFRGSRKSVVAALVSSVFHCALLVVIALLGFDTTRKPPRIELDGSVDPYVAPEIASLPKSTVKLEHKPEPAAKKESSSSLANVIVPDPSQGLKGSEQGTEPKPAVAALGNGGIGELMTPIGGGSGEVVGMLDGRHGELKQALLDEGGSEDTEIAVARGLRWLAAHQLEDGSWHFDHRQEGVCKYCANPGSHGSRTAATGLALLPFLGANKTHRTGEYQETVAKGLAFLKRKMIATPLGGDLQDGVNLYSQAIATLALCEAYAMTRDPELDRPCRDAILFIVNSQDKKGGGWRYFPGQVGDTTVTGWMLMALKSGQISYIPIPADVWPLAKKFLDGVQDDGGAAYGYQSPAKNEPTMTAIGILSRMYGGWPRSEPALQRAVRSLSKKGHSDHDQYYNYYATQTLRHYGGQEWIAWNEEMKAFLLQSQSRQGHSSGSWYFPDKHGDQGGRLYNTAMSILALEVYYRYLPIYGKRATSADFK